MGQIRLFFILETAGLLPAKFWRHYNEKDWDVRENLFRHHAQLQSQQEINNEIDGYQADQPRDASNE